MAVPRFLGVERGIEEGGSHAVGDQRIDLILHQSDQRGNHQRQPIPGQGGDLVADRFASARRQDGDDVATGERGSDDLLLIGAERVVSVDFFEDGVNAPRHRSDFSLGRPGCKLFDQVARTSVRGSGSEVSATFRGRNVRVKEIPYSKFAPARAESKSHREFTSSPHPARHVSDPPRRAGVGFHRDSREADYLARP